MILALIKLVVLALLSLLVLGLVVGAVSAPGSTGLLIIVTAPPLRGDVERIVERCGDAVISLVPPGTDIHEYQLTSKDLELLKSAHLVVSTGHTSFELKIRNLVERGEVRARLVDVLEIPGLKLSVNPATGQPNYHMPIKDPVNYLLFISNLTRTLAEINPERAECYYSNYFRVLSEVYTSILVHRGVYSGVAVVDTPHSQYYVEWMGFRVAWILKYEEEVPVTVESLEKTRELLSSGVVRVVVVTEGFQGAIQLASEARERGIPIITVPSPYSDTSVLDGIRLVVNQLAELRALESSEAPSTSSPRTITLQVVALVFVSGVMVGATLVELHRRWISWRLKHYY